MTHAIFPSFLAPKDVNAGEGSEFADSGIEGATTDTDLLSRRSNATHSSYSPPPGRAFVGSDSGSSSTGDAARQGVYENFRRELELSAANRESLEDAGSAHSDERSSGAPSSPGRSDVLREAARGTVRKAGALAVKNFLVHKKNRKVEPAARRRWKHYWASLKGEHAPGAPSPARFLRHLRSARYPIPTPRLRRGWGGCSPELRPRAWRSGC